MKFSQAIEVYLRWIYNSGETQGNNSLEYHNAVMAMAKIMDVELPSPNQCTPDNVGARLRQHAETLLEGRKQITSLLGFNGV